MKKPPKPPKKRRETKPQVPQPGERYLVEVEVYEYPYDVSRKFDLDRDCVRVLLCGDGENDGAGPFGPEIGPEWNRNGSGSTEATFGVRVPLDCLRPVK